MSLKLFNNIGFRPSGDTLKYWMMLPQVSTSVDGEKVPSLFGNLKSVNVAIIMTVLLIVVEIFLIIQLNEEGVGFLAMLGISIFDFIVAILPPIILLKTDLIPAQIDAHIFVANQKIKIPYQHPDSFNNKDHFVEYVNEEIIKVWKKKKNHIAIINILFFLIILALSAWKFIINYEILGPDIFVEPIGRFILTVILLGIIVHTLFTKNVYLYFQFSNVLIPHGVRICAKRYKKRVSKVRFESTKNQTTCLPSTSAKPTLNVQNTKDFIIL